MSEARAEILARIRRAVGGSAARQPGAAPGDAAESRAAGGSAALLPGDAAESRAAPGDAAGSGEERAYRRVGDHPAGAPALVELLVDRLRDYRATVRITEESALPGVLAEVLAEVLPAAGGLVIPPGLPAGWAPGDAVVDDGTLDWARLDAVGAVLTRCAAAAAETGTIVLDGSPDQGRRAITLIPDWHVCVVYAAQVVQTVPELLARLDPTRPLTFVSGPSATSDIELRRVEGVHGPRNLIVIVVNPEIVTDPLNSSIVGPSTEP